ncbi:Beta-hydroxylase%2C aspartyl/asparaginyl family [Yersinia enterocolitica]|uniref:Beta-hydroxylase, aspartyl/asparaginyl family n=1 Tax=Yersinia enterocolitica TaxID=630 RepID=A0ABM9S754_YEREN|nr:Beta-hydroxylase%2C aspartyl/asparaginyl family [Yersinia enterocolitica]CNE32285.1 Beta-hydroxylase%2C aspartyl/asparaginyl family [Yersinia enterocolitica]CNF31550.1 Beta-hydroxylase%2C aspartyl/asparaginyl family [Yersinia enterocolitica]CNG05086.1 Beta-hydroxylase%2C aspartyl/asparaginyl family [Yersinia enterocolitica]CQD71402.1 Beta-hydroxylase%2C aspartyl/asparaginyl family [Yersinia enterocolitica]
MKYIVLFIFILCVAYVHFRGKVRYTGVNSQTIRHLSHQSMFLCIYSRAFLPRLI